MCRIGRTVLIQGFVGISVISHYQDIVSFLPRCICYRSRTLINGCHSFFDRLVNPCVTNHITVCEIQADEIVLFRIDRFYHGVPYAICTHLGLKIISGDLRRRNKYPVFIFKDLFTSS